MKLYEILALKPGSLFKGIEVKSHIPHLSLVGWSDIEKHYSGKYPIKWINNSNVAKCFNKYEFQNPDPEQPFKQVKTIKEHDYESAKILSDVLNDIVFINSGEPIGMFLGEILITDLNTMHGIIFLKVLNAANIGWIVLECSNTYNTDSVFVLQ